MKGVETMENAKKWYAEVSIDDLAGTQQSMAEIIGVEATLMLCEVYGGAGLYIPKNDKPYEVFIRNREIRRRYLKGASIRTLAAEHNLTDRSILRIVQGYKPQQVKVFDLLDGLETSEK